MMFRIALSDKAHAELIDFCTKNLKPGIDPVNYADALEDAADMSEGALFEIGRLDSKTGNPATILFRADADFRWEEIEE